MKILFFTKGDKNTASSRQRVWLLAEHLQKKFGINYEIQSSISYRLFVPSKYHILSLLSVASIAKKRDINIYFVHKSLIPFDVVLLILLMKRLYRKKMIYDLDDAEWIHSRFKSHLLAKSADLVLCGSDTILEWAKKKNKRSHKIPTVIDHEAYAKYRIEHVEKKELVVGWVGHGPGYFKGGHFNILKDVLLDLAFRRIPVHFVMIGSKGNDQLKKFFLSERYRTTFIDELDWGEVGAVAKKLNEYGVDIGVAPLLDTPFDRAKCAFKIIEYMGVGLPVVVSPIGEQRTLVRDGIDGFHARSKDEWVQMIRKLRDPLLREKMGLSALNRVKDHYLFMKIVPQLYRLLIELSFK